MVESFNEFKRGGGVERDSGAGDGAGRAAPVPHRGGKDLRDYQLDREMVERQLKNDENDEKLRCGLLMRTRIHLNYEIRVGSSSLYSYTSTNDALTSVVTTSTDTDCCGIDLCT